MTPKKQTTTAREPFNQQMKLHTIKAGSDFSSRRARLKSRLFRAYHFAAILCAALFSSAAFAQTPSVVEFVIDSYIQEGQSSELRMTRNGDPSTRFSVHYHAVGITAVAGRDFEPMDGTALFAPGEMSKTIVLKTLDNGQIDSPRLRTLSIQLDSPTDGVGLGARQAAVTIADNESPASQPVLSFPNDLLTRTRLLGLQSDGRMVIATESISTVLDPMPLLVQLDADGTVNSAFHASFERAPSGDRSLPVIRELWIDPDDSVVVHGLFKAVNGQPRTNGWARLLANGALAPDLGSLPSTGDALVLHRFRDGRILLDDPGNFRIFTVTGIEQTNFVPDLFFELQPRWGDAGRGADQAEDNEGRILGIRADRENLVRIRRDGTEDPTFRPTWGNLESGRYLTRLAVQPDGRILVQAIGWDAAKGADFQGIVRLHSDGSLDPTFVSAPEAKFWFGGITFQNDGRILLDAGEGILRLHPNGSLDQSFQSVPLLVPRANRITYMGLGISRGTLFLSGSKQPPLESDVLRGQINGIPFAGVVALRLNSGPATAAVAFWVDNQRYPQRRDEAVTITVRRLGESLRTARVSYATRDRTALAGRDYTSRSGVLDFAALEVEKEVVVPLLDNSSAFLTRNFEFVLSDPHGFEEVSSPLTVQVHGSRSGLESASIQSVLNRCGEVSAASIVWEDNGDGSQVLEVSKDLRSWVVPPEPTLGLGPRLREFHEFLPEDSQRRFYRLRVNPW